MSSIGASRAAERRPEGFTVVELMVALMAGVLVILSTYFLGAASARHFHEQQRIAQAQSALRNALDRLRHDLARAGYLGTPNAARAPQCLPPAVPLAAIDRWLPADPAATAWLPNAEENRVSADTVEITGNFATDDSYLAIGLSAAGNEIVLQRNWQGFRRSFGEPFDNASFEAAFRPGRLLHITTQQNMHFFVLISETSADQASIRFTPALPIGGACVVGLADGALVAPLARIRYTVVDLVRSGSDEGTNLAPRGGLAAQDLQGVTTTQLVRQEISFADGSVVAGSTIPLLEYVADFAVDFVRDTAPEGSALPILRRVDRNVPGDVGLALANPHTLRSVRLRLSSRTPEQDPRFPWVARAAGQPLLRYRVNDALPGAARVRTLSAEVLLPNLGGAG